MNDRDRELDELLKPLQNVKPTAMQMKKWQMLAPRRRQTTFARRLVELAVAAAVGFVVGASIFKQLPEPTHQFVATNFDPDATIERVYSKGH